MSRTSIELAPVLSIRPTLKMVHVASQKTDCQEAETTPWDGAAVPSAELLVEEKFNLSKFRMTLVIINVASVEFLRSVVEGLVIIQLPTIAADINLDRGLLLW